MHFAEFCSHLPRQQFVDAIDRMLGNASKHVPQVTIRLHAVEQRRADQAVDGSGPFTARIGASEQIIAPPQYQRAD